MNPNRRHAVRAVLAAVLLVAAACTQRTDDLAITTRAVVADQSLVAGEPDAAGMPGSPTAAGDRTSGSGGSIAGATSGSGGGLGELAGPGRPGPAPREVIKLGTVLPLQGGQRGFGVPVLRTTQAFVDELNARGGLDGHPVELIAYNACLLCQDEAYQAVRRLVEEDDVFALVNTYPMVVAFLGVIDYLVDHNVPLIQGGAEDQTSDALSPINFTSAPTGSFYGRFIPKMAGLHSGMTRVGITYIGVPSEEQGIPKLRRELEREGIEVVAVEEIAAAEEAVTNMDSAVTRMRAAGADGVVATNPVLLIWGRLAADRQGWDVPWTGPAAWSELVEEGCGSTCDDIVLTDTAGLSYIDRDSPQMHEFLDTMARRYPGGQITGHTLAAWVGMQLTVEVLRRVPAERRLDPQAFLDAMHQVRDLDLGTTSPLTFTPDRHMGGSASILLRLQGGRYVQASEPLDYGEIED